MNKHNTDFLIPNLYSPESGRIADISPYKNKKLLFAKERNKI